MGSIIGTLIGAISATIGAIGSLGNSFVTLNNALAAEFGQANVLEFGSDDGEHSGVSLFSDEYILLSISRSR
jgi:hypothetical protein